MVRFSLLEYHQSILVTNHFRNAICITVLVKVFSNIIVNMPLKIATCVWSVRICKSSQSQVSSFHFSEYHMTQPVLGVFSVGQLLRLSRIHMHQSCWAAMQASPQGSCIFLKIVVFIFFLTKEVQYLKWVKEIFHSQVLADKVPGRREV